LVLIVIKPRSNNKKTIIINTTNRLNQNRNSPRVKLESTASRSNKNGLKNYAGKSDQRQHLDSLTPIDPTHDLSKAKEVK
jgi:hypothetical protein